MSNNFITVRLPKTEINVYGGSNNLKLFRVAINGTALQTKQSITYITSNLADAFEISFLETICAVNIGALCYKDTNLTYTVENGIKNTDSTKLSTVSSQMRINDADGFLME
jgi:hypothetical protein